MELSTISTIQLLYSHHDDQMSSMSKNAFYLLALLAFSSSAPAQSQGSDPDELIPFEASYQASVKGLRASATRSLEPVHEGQYRYSSSVTLKLLGKTLTRIREHSLFTWEDNMVVPSAYEFTQTGIGSRSRSISFDWEEEFASATVNEHSTVLPLDVEVPVFDELNVFIELRNQLAAGAKTISLLAVDGSTIQEDTYQVLGEEPVDTQLGRFAAIKLEKVRQPDSDRETILWLAKNWDFMLLKLYQREGGQAIELSIDEAIVGDTRMAASGSLDD